MEQFLLLQILFERIKMVYFYLCNNVLEKSQS